MEYSSLPVHNEYYAGMLKQSDVQVVYHYMELPHHHQRCTPALSSVGKSAKMYSHPRQVFCCIYDDTQGTLCRCMYVWMCANRGIATHTDQTLYNEHTWSALWGKCDAYLEKYQTSQSMNGYCVYVVIFNIDTCGLDKQYVKIQWH